MAGDPHWASVVLAMHMDGANNSTTFTDSKGKAVSATGGAAISTAQSKFGGASLLLNGTTQWLSTPANTGFDFGSGDFTIDGWIRRTATSASSSVVLTCRPAAAANGFILLVSSEGYLNFNAGDTDTNAWNAILTGTTLVSLNTWHHIAAVRNGNVFTIYLNGVAEATATVSFSIASSAAVPLYIGASDAATGYFPGHIDDLRITKGVARYTANFTPPAAAFLEYAGQLSGTVKDDTGTLCARTVRAYLRSSGVLEGSATSDAGTGAYTINTPTLGTHTVIALDDVAGTQYNALVLDHLTPA